MSRKLRIQYPDAVYHIINRGNYRADIFATQGARDAFAKALDEACSRNNWIVHAWCLMTNHYHLALRTGDANLVRGMQWFQSTFSARFNRFRNERGHVFQGRYKAFNIEPGKALGSVCHYIHLNPIRAHMMTIGELAEWHGCSLRWILKSKQRPGWFDPVPALRQPAELADTPAGRRAYVKYLAGLASDDDEQRNQHFGEMMSGWALGSDKFKMDLIGKAPDPTETGIGDVAEARVLKWQKTLRELKSKLGERNMKGSAKSADWKVALAAEMKRRTTATNQWLADTLEMGNMFTVSRLARECRSGKRASKLLHQLTTSAAN